MPSGIRLRLVHPSAARTLLSSLFSADSALLSLDFLNRILRVFLRASASPRQANLISQARDAPPSPDKVLPLGHRLRRHVPTPHRALHRRRPAAPRPIAGQIHVGNGTLRSRP